MDQVTTKSSKDAYTVNSFSENLIIIFENPHSNFQSWIVGVELRDDAVLNIDFSI